MVILQSNKDLGYKMHTHTSSLAGSSSLVVLIIKAKKHKTDPIHRSIAKPPNNCFKNLTHSGVVLGGLKAFGPSLSNTSAALLFVSP